MKRIRHIILNIVLFLFAVSANANILTLQNHYTEPDVYNRLEQEIVKHRQAARNATIRTSVLGYIGILLLLFAIYAVGKWRSTQRNNRILAQQITEAVKYKKKYQELRPTPIVVPSKNSPSEMSDSELFIYLRELIESERLYLDPQFDRQTLIQKTGLSKERIGAAFSQGSDQERITTLVRELRLEYAVHLINEQPELNVEQVCMASGFTNADTFTRNFKTKYGMAPSVYMKTKA